MQSFLSRRRLVAVAVASAAALGVTSLVAAFPARAVDAAQLTTANVRSFGAVCNGITDDTHAIQKSFDWLTAGRTVVIPVGGVCRHSSVLTLSQPGTVTGPGTLLASNEASSAVIINADHVTLNGSLILKMGITTKRWSAPHQHKLVLNKHGWDTVSHVTINGSAAAGIFVYGAHDYVLDHDTVEYTRADGIHNTNGSYNGTIIAPVVRDVGDDAVAVVSYAHDGTPCHDITVTWPRVFDSGSTHGRGLVVSGGTRITFTHILVDSPNGAAVLIASERFWNTLGTTHILVAGGTITNANTGAPSPTYGAVLVNDQQPYGDSDIVIRDLAISTTTMAAGRQVGILVTGAGAVSQVQLLNFRFTGGPAHLFATDAPSSAYKIAGWSQNGIAAGI